MTGGDNGTIYLDNAATSWPKPEPVIAAMESFLRHHAANPGRSGHALSIEAARRVQDAREAVASLAGLRDPLCVAFTKNATEALNVAIQGTVGPGDHVVTSVMEHNSVLRPLSALESRGVAVTRVPADARGVVDPGTVLAAVTDRTRLVVLAHATNVVGALCPVDAIGAALAARDVLFCVDAAQTAGTVPIDMAAMGIDLLAFTGHKGLLGPTGTGGLCLGPRAADRVRPLMQGGTGSASDRDRQPGFLPDRLEAGTLNAVGLAGLAAGIAFVAARGVDAIRRHEVALAARLIDGLRAIPGVRVQGPGDPAAQVAVVSFTIDGVPVHEVAMRLEERAGVCCRVGLHCAPLAHRLLGTFPAGTVRFSPGVFTTDSEIDTALVAVRAIAAEAAGGVA
jgi:cysteine desulfurase family protein